MDPTVIILDRGQAVHPPLTNGRNARNPAALRAVVNQLGVATNPRYRATTVMVDGKEHHITYCNILSWDYTSAMEAELPHWTMPDGTIAKPHTPGAVELNCNRLLGWLMLHGAEHEWVQLENEAEACAYANAGKPVVAIWRNPTGGPGHIAVGVPSPSQELHIAQAGGVNFDGRPLRDGFATVSPVLFWGHP